MAVAAVLALQPPVLALDEPTSPARSLGRGGGADRADPAQQDLGLTVVLAEHRLERVIGHVDRLRYLPGPGQPAIDGPARETLARMPDGPPLVALGRRLGWAPLPLTISEGRRRAVTIGRWR